MAPLAELFPSSTLPDHVQTTNANFQTKRRKGAPIDLHSCELLEMVQFSCNPPDGEVPEPGVVKCKPFVRLFRRCAGGLTVETTAWDRIKNKDKNGGEKRISDG